MLVFWETTTACPLACRHCRAAATCQPSPDELSAVRGSRLVEQIAAFGPPHPVLVLTGGDCLLRRDLFEIVDYADSLGVPVALAPAVSPLLSESVIERIANGPVRAVSISLDGLGETHDGSGESADITTRRSPRSELWPPLGSPSRSTPLSCGRTSKSSPRCSTPS
jgi:MoaA/NifB/PqqE/SkfB family radical SAM enzyme